jgi:hypothetical protein
MSRLEDLQKELQVRKFSPPCDKDTEENAPFLWEFLSTTMRDDGTPRIRPIVKIELVSGAFRVTLQDDEFLFRVAVICQRLCDMVPALEAALSSGSGFEHMEKSYRNKRKLEVPGVKPGDGKRRKKT